MNFIILKFPFSSTKGGGEIHTFNLCDHLITQGHSVELISSCPVLIEEFKKRNWKYTPYSLGKEPVTPIHALLFLFKRKFLKLKLTRVLSQKHKETPVDALLCLSLTEKCLSLGRFLKKRKIKWIWLEHVLIDRWLTQNPLRFWYRKNATQAKIITVSNCIQKQLRSILVPPTSIEVIWHGIRIPQKEKNPPKPTHSFYKNKFVIGTACRLHKEKGVHDLILAVRNIAEIRESLYVLIVGEGPEKNNLTWLAKQHKLDKIIRFTGWQEPVRSWIQKMNVFVLPSYRESFGLVLLEAFKEKVPVIATRTGGIPEVVEHEQTGLLYPPGEHERLSQYLILLARNLKLRQKLTQNAYCQLKNRFSEEKMWSKYDAIIQS